MKNNSISISVFGYEDKGKHPIYVSKQFCEEKHIDYYCLEKNAKDTMLLLKFLVLHV